MRFCCGITHFRVGNGLNVPNVGSRTILINVLMESFSVPGTSPFIEMGTPDSKINFFEESIPKSIVLARV